MDSPGQRFGCSLGRLGMATVAVVVIGLVAGWLFGRTTPRHAAAVVVGDFVTEEAIRDGRPPPDGVAAPTSGAHDGQVRCGATSSPVTVADQLASLEAGIVAIQYVPDAMTGAQTDMLEAIVHARAERVLLAPNPRLDADVVATAHGRRMRLGDANRELLSAFVTAYAGVGAPGAGCDPGAQ